MIRKRKVLGDPDQWLDWLLRQAKDHHDYICGKYCKLLNHNDECLRDSFRMRDAEEVLRGGIKR